MFLSHLFLFFFLIEALFLGNTYPCIEFRSVFQSIKRAENFFPVICTRQLCTNVRVVDAGVLIMAKHHTILLFAAESIWGST